MRIQSALIREIFERSLMSVWGKIFLALLAVVVGICSFLGLYIIPLALVVLLAGCIIGYYCLFKPYIGFYILTFIAFFAFYPNHILNRDIPLSTAVEILVWIVFIGSMKERPAEGIRNNLVSNPVSIMFIIYTGYHVVEYFNPNLGVKDGYFFVMRKYVMFVFIYILGYRLVNTPAKFRQFLKFWIIMAVIGALYGCYQQWFGYLPMEIRYLKKNPREYALLFQGGQLRKISFFSDVVTFGVLSGSMCVITIILAIHEKNKKKRNLLIVSSLFLLLGMSYTGTRTTNVILPIGISLYILMTIKRKSTLITIFASFMFVLGVLFAPIHNNKTLNRVRSTFRTNEPSLDVRNDNRHHIQPYIYSHPIGGGLASTGLPGKRFNPDHPLAGFPPDSGLLQIALEIGYLGLGFTIIWYMLIIYQCIYIAFRVKNQEYKIYATAIACSLISIMVTQYSQASIGQIPTVIFFMAIIAIIRRLQEFDNAGLS